MKPTQITFSNSGNLPGYEWKETEIQNRGWIYCKWVATKRAVLLHKGKAIAIVYRNSGYYRVIAEAKSANRKCRRYDEKVIKEFTGKVDRYLLDTIKSINESVI